MAKKEMTRETLLEEISKWQEENKKNRAAFVVLCERENEEDAGNSKSAILGHGLLLVNSIGTIAGNNEGARALLRMALVGGNPLQALANMLSLNDEDEKTLS